MKVHTFVPNNEQMKLQDLTKYVIITGTIYKPFSATKILNAFQQLERSEQGGSEIKIIAVYGGHWAATVYHSVFSVCFDSIMK